MFSSFYLIGMLLVHFGNAQSFEAVAFGNRVFTENADAFLGEINGVVDIVIVEGEATLSVAPILGTIKQADCVDVVEVNGVISISNEELSFCYEGGPQMLEGAVDSATFDIVGDDGAVATYVATFNGNDPVVPLDQGDRLVLTQENVAVDINVNTDLAAFADDVTEIDAFQIEIIEPPRAEAGILTDDSGNEIIAGTIVNSDQVLTFTPAEDFSNCDPNDSLFGVVCEDIINDPPPRSNDQFLFRIIVGEGDEQVILEEELSFLLLVEFRVPGELNIINDIVFIRVQDEVNNVVSIDVDTVLSIVVDDEEDNDRKGSIRFVVSTVDSFSINRADSLGPTASEFAAVSCVGDLDFLCNLLLIDTIAVLNTEISNTLTLNFVADELEAADAILQVSLNGGEFQTITFQPLDALEVVAFGNRVLTVSAQEFLDENDEVIAAGEAVLLVAPIQGTLKQADCVEVVDVDAPITFENEELIFCYEGGPDMLTGVDDIVTFDIVGGDGATASLDVNFAGADPVAPVLLRLLQANENQPLAVPITDLAIFEDDVDLLDAFQIEILQLPSGNVGVFTNAAGDLIANGAILNNDEILTFTPIANFFNCANFDGLLEDLALCGDIIADPEESPDQFQFRIIFGEAEDQVVGETVDFFILVEVETVGELVIENQNIVVPAADAVNGFVSIVLDTSAISVIIEEGQELDVLQLRFTSQDEDILFLEPQPDFPQGLTASGTTDCSDEGLCEIFVSGTAEVVNDTIENEILTLNFDASQLEVATLEVSLNGDEQVETITFVSDLVTEAPAPPEDEGLSDAGVAVLATFGALAGIALIGAVVFVSVNRNKDEETPTEDKVANEA